MFTKNKMERKEMVPIISTSFESLILHITYFMLELKRLIYQESDSSMIIFNSSVEENVGLNLLSLSLVIRKKECKDLSPWKLLQHRSWAARLGGSDDLDDQSREHIIRVMDMRVTLHDKRVAALVADGVEGLTLSHHIDFITWPVVQELVPSHSTTFISDSLPYRGQQDQA